MIEIKQSDWCVGCEMDLMTYGLGPRAGIVVGYNAAVSMLHAPMPDAGGAEEFSQALEESIPPADRSGVHPILAGGHGMLGKPVSAVMRKTRAWVEQELLTMCFGCPVVR